MKLLHAGVDIADMALKQRALDRTAPTGARPGCYKASDRLIAFLDGL